MSEEFRKTAQQMALENAALQKELKTEREKAACVLFDITIHDFDGSVKGKLHELKLPVGAIPLGFDVIIQNMDTKEQHREYWLDSVKEPIQSEWLDNEHTKFVAVIDGKLKKYQIITRVYCMMPKSAGIPALGGLQESHIATKASGTWRVDNLKLMEDIKQDLNAAVDSKDHSEVLRLIESAKEKLDFLNIELKEVGENTKPVGAIPVHLNPKAYIGTNIKEGTTDVSIHIQHAERVVSGADIKHLVVMWEDGQHHEVRFPIYLLEAQHE